MKRGCAVRIESNINGVFNQLQQEIRDLLTVAGEYVAGEAILNLERNGSNDEGALASSIGHKLHSSPSGIIVRISAGQDYAAYVEFGTGKFSSQPGSRQEPWVYYYEGNKGRKGFRWTEGQKPAPFLRPALLNNLEKIRSIFA